MFLNLKNSFILICIAIVSDKAKASNIILGTPDIVVPLPTLTQNTYIRLEAFKTGSSNQWTSLGIPKLVEKFHDSRPNKIKFDSDSIGFSIGMQFLTDEHRNLLINKTNEKYNITSTKNQFTQIPITKLICSLSSKDPIDPSITIKYNGIVGDLTRFPLKIQFPVSSQQERNRFKKHLNMGDLIMKCEIEMKSILRKNFVISVKNNEIFFTVVEKDPITNNVPIPKASEASEAKILDMSKRLIDGLIKQRNKLYGECIKLGEFKKNSLNLIDSFKEELEKLDNLDESLEEEIHYEVQSEIDTNSDWAIQLTLLKNEKLAFGTSYKTIDIWNVQEPELISSLQGHYYDVVSLVLLNNGYLASGSRDRVIKIWDVQREIPVVVKNLNGHTGIVFCLAQLNNKYLASGSEDNTIRIWDIYSGKLNRTIEIHSDWVYSLARLDNGNLASASADKTIKIWDPEKNPVRVIHTLTGHDSYVRGLLKLKKGNLASYSDDGTIKLWDASRGILLKTLKGHKMSVTGLIELSNGYLVSSGKDMTLRIWNSSSGKLLKTISESKSYIDSLLPLDNSMFASSSRGKIQFWK